MPQLLAESQLATPLILYLASAAGAVGLFLMKPQTARPIRTVGAIIGAATLGLVWLLLYNQSYDIEMVESALPFYYIFSFLAIAAAVFVIASRKPVHAALWFVMVILATAGLFLTLTAEFMALAMVIIYGGAILVTYMFVIMLAAFTGDPENAHDLPDYDMQWRNPLAAIVCGFLLLAVLLTVSFQPISPNGKAAAPSDQEIIATTLTDRSTQRMAERLEAAVTPEQLDKMSAVMRTNSLDNIERVGLDLFESHPLGLELAGVILLVALIGAVVIAKTHVEQEGAAAHG